ncbi:MAG: hypothetical protein JNL62_07600 [Bryobacterales bacterium]|nr:hypothetical protein [Bryobacterales bacterium]
MTRRFPSGMNLELREIPKAECDRLRHFLRGIFQPNADDATFLDPAQMLWKYWEPNPGWTGDSRSYAFIDDSGEIIAHACAWPFGLRTKEAELCGVHLIDWAAGMKVPGAGALLLREMRALRDISCCIGGTHIAQNVVRQSGFKQLTTMHFLARPLRPLRQALTHQRQNWKTPARFLRNTVWVMRSASVLSGWTAEPISPGEITGNLLPAPGPGQAVAHRSAALFEYMAQCPTARYQLWLVRQGAEARGYFLLSIIFGQARVADAWITEATSESWSALYALAAQVALRHHSVAEITTSVTLPDALAGAAVCGFRPYGELAVMVFDPKKHLAFVSQFHLQMLDNDASFLHRNCIEYVT